MNELSSGCFIVDRDFNIITFNEIALRLFPELETGKKCYACLMKSDTPCSDCPVLQGQKGPKISLKAVDSVVEAVDVIDIDIPGYGACHELVFTAMGEASSMAEIVNSPAEVLSHLALIKALTVDYYDVLSVDLTDDRVTVYRHNGKPVNADTAFMGNIDYARAVRNYAARYVVEEDRQLICENSSLEAVREKLKKSESMTVHYRVILNGELHYFYRKFVRVGDADHFESVVIGVGCEDVEVLPRLRNEQLTQNLNDIEYSQETGLYTKEAFLLHGAEMLRDHPEKRFDFCILKVENHTLIRHQYGQRMADSLLSMIGRMLKKYDSPYTCLAYLGGSVFASFTENQPNDLRRKAVLQFRDDISAAGENPKMELKWSIYENVPNNAPVEEIIEKAQYALSMIRTSSDEDYIEFDQTVIDRMEWEDAVKDSFEAALLKGEFKTWYQPKYSARTKEIVGAEALIRWEKSSGELIPPAMFVPILEKWGKISRLDEYVLRQVCRLQNSLKQAGLNIPISVNLSRASVLTRNIADSYANIAGQYGVAPEMVPIEITESAAVRAASMLSLADELIRRGFVLHMDDFGSGYSSLASLQIIPFQSIKLDKSLVDFIGVESGENLLRHTIAFIRESGKTVVAEGVETGEQYVFLKALGCDIIQGFYFSRPVDEACFVEMLKNST